MKPTYILGHRIDSDRFEFNIRLDGKESAVRNFTILYDNGKKFKVGSPTNTNVREVSEKGKLTYTKHSGNIKTDFTICMSDVAAIQITSVNGDVSLRKFKDCAKFNVNMSKK